MERRVTGAKHERKENEAKNKKKEREEEEKEANRFGNDRKRERSPLASTYRAVTVEVPQLLLVLESCFLDGLDCAHLLREVPTPTLVEWELSSNILKDGLAKTKWWKVHFKQSYPATYERFRLSARCQQGAKLLLSQPSYSDDDMMRGLTLILERDDTLDRRVWRETIRLEGYALQSRHAAQSCDGDEFGLDSVHQLLFGYGSDDDNTTNHTRKPLLRTCVWNGSCVDTVTQGYFDFNKQDGLKGSVMIVAQVWSLSFRGACLVLLQNRETGRQELVWVKTTVPPSQLYELHDVRYWALNHNVLPENVDDFVVPVVLDGSTVSQETSSEVAVSLHLHPVLVSTTEDWTSVVMGGKVVLVFDKLKLDESWISEGGIPKNRHWRDLLTDELLEPDRGGIGGYQTIITASCFVLDAFLLLATNDGVIRARPRSNLKSEYYVENLKSMVSHMTSLFNVVALVHGYCILEIRQMSQVEEDPFIQSVVLYQTKGVNCDHAPLLYGPYVVFAGLDGCWYRVKYDSGQSLKLKPNKEEIRLPRHAGWKILAVKNANWRCLTIVAEDPKTRKFEELNLLIGGASRVNE